MQQLEFGLLFDYGMNHAQVRQVVGRSMAQCVLQHELISGIASQGDLAWCFYRPHMRWLVAARYGVGWRAVDTASRMCVNHFKISDDIRQIAEEEE